MSSVTTLKFPFPILNTNATFSILLKNAHYCRNKNIEKEMSKHRKLNQSKRCPIWPEVLSRYVYLLICIPFAINWRFISHIPHGRPSSFHYFITSLCWKHKNKTQMKLLYKSKILIHQCVDHVISTGRWMLKLVLKIDPLFLFSFQLLKIGSIWKGPTMQNSATQKTIRYSTACWNDMIQALVTY